MTTAAVTVYERPCRRGLSDAVWLGRQRASAFSAVFGAHGLAELAPFAFFSGVGIEQVVATRTRQ